MKQLPIKGMTVVILALAGNPVFAADDSTIVVDHAAISQLQTNTDSAVQDAAIGVISNLEEQITASIHVGSVTINQVQVNVSSSQQEVEIGRVDFADGTGIGIYVNDVDVVQKQHNVSTGEQLAQIGAVIGTFGNPIQANTNLTVVNLGDVVQEQNASNHIRQTVRIGVLTNTALNH